MPTKREMQLLWYAIKEGMTYEEFLAWSPQVCKVVVQPDGRIEQLSAPFPTIPDSVWLGYFAGQAMANMMAMPFDVMGNIQKEVNWCADRAAAMLAEMKWREGQDA